MAKCSSGIRIVSDQVPLRTINPLTVQLRKLQEATNRAEQIEPQGFESIANVKLFRALSHLIMETVPSDPARYEFGQGNMGSAYRHWRRAKIGRRLFPRRLKVQGYCLRLGQRRKHPTVRRE